MISLILPYFERWDAACKALLSIGKAYRGMALEIVVVDDGSIRQPFWEPAIAFPEGMTLKIVKLPPKTEPKSPVTCWNEGVRQSAGDIVVLSCVEVLHDRPVLGAMLEELKRQGPDAYVLAAAFCPESGEWHCHSEHSASGSYPLPKGTGRGFCGMLSKTLYEKAGGWDEDYRDGAGYEDVDFVYRMLRAGAKFVIRDDLVVTHPKTGASINWGAKKFARNKALLDTKWRKVTFCCVQAGNYCGRGAEYVNKLYDMVTRNLPNNVFARFVCLTDDSTGLDAGIDTLPLPADLEGWYGKLYMFNRGLFADGERVVFMDLDTVIIGRLDELLSYDGQFATLRDFYAPERLGPAVISWLAGDFAASIWEEWVAAGKPRNAMGDLWWINNLDQGRFAKEVHKLQDIYPGAFASYKRDCRFGPPANARVICFHGLPRPHEVDDEWVKVAWQVGGFQPAAFEMVINTNQNRRAENIAHACSLDIPWIQSLPPRGGEALIVGGSPSMKMMLPEIRKKAENGTVFAVNGVANFLEQQGIRVDYQVVIDARDNAHFISPAAKHYLLASQCDKAMFDRADLSRTTLVHMHTADIEKHIPPTMKQITLISSGTTVGLAAIALSYVLGFRSQWVYGMDSSYDDGGEHHAYAQIQNDGDPVINAVAGGRAFKTTPWMVEQVNNFQTLARQLADDGCEIHMRSFGLLGHVAWLMTQQAEAA